MANAKLVENWTFRRTLPEPFQDYTDKAVFKDIGSRYSTQPKKKSTLHAATLQAILTYLELEMPKSGKTAEELGAIGTQTNLYTIAEYPSRTGELHVVIYNKSNGKFTAGRYTVPPDTENAPGKYVFQESGNSGAALLFALMPTLLSDDEFNEKYQQLKKDRDDGYPDIEQTAETAAVLCDNAYRRIRYSDTLPSAGIRTDISSNGVIPLLKPLAIQNGIYAPTEIIHGTFQVIRPGNAYKKAQEVIAKADFIGKYILSPDRILTPEEELTVPELPDWYIIPKEVKRICEHAKLTTDTVQPMRNFLLRGPAGTGKTEGAKAIASGLHLPYRCLTCSANTEVFDLLGQILPDVDGKRTSLEREYPTFQDIMLDPAGAYEKLTGNYDENITEEAVYKQLIDTIFEEMHEFYASKTSQQHFRYVDTPLVEAIRNGYLIEIQEPTVIANPGVLVGLNSLMDRCNCVFLPNGETVKRHPDMVIVVTTNNDYAGCRPLNQSVLSRMNMLIDLMEPDEETLVERVLGITGCKEKNTVRTMARIVHSISDYCQANLITDGCCGVRELISWVQSYMVCGDIRESAQYTILPSATADAASRTEVETSCMDTVLTD